MSDPVRFTLDGRDVAHATRAGRSALDVLREDLGCHTLKPGCAPQGICGSCTASVDGKPRLLCTLAFSRLEGRAVHTLAGLPEPEREALAEAFARTGAAQCGACIPGIATQAALLLRRDPDPDDDSIGRALAMHACRCTGWRSIFEAVRLAGALLRGEARPGPEARAEGRALTLGERPFVDDLRLPGMLHAAVARAPAPSGVLAAVDVEAARAAPGVRAVLLAEDVPGERVLGLGGPRGPLLLALGERVRGLGDAVALIVADSRDEARAACAQVAVRLDPAEAAPEPPVEARVAKGQIDLALDEPGLVLAKVNLSAAPVDPAPLEAPVAVVTPRRGGGLHLWTHGEAPFDEARQIAATLALPPEAVTVEALMAGGGFGARLEATVSALAALGALRAGRPVKLSLDLDEAQRFTPRQPAAKVRMMLAARPGGTFVGLKVFVRLDLGARPTLAEPALRELAAHAAGPYGIPHVEVQVEGLRSDNPSAGPVRGGAGLPALTAALEGCVDRMAEALSVDALALRLQNLVAEGEDLGSGQILSEPSGLPALLHALAPARDLARAEGRATGLAVAMRGLSPMGGVRARAAIDVLPGPRLRVRTGFTEQGQGHDTQALRLVAERLGLPSEALDWCCEGGDVASGPALGGRDRVLGLPAALAAAGALATARDAAGSLDALAGQTFTGEAEAPVPAVAAKGAPAPLYAVGWVAELAVLDAEGRLEALHVALDAGELVCADTTRAQAEGAALMGLGLALSESAEPVDGLPPARYRDLGVIRAANAPRVHVDLRASAAGARPLALTPADELAMIPTAAAVAAALHALDGQRRAALPMKEGPAAASVGVRQKARTRA